MDTMDLDILDSPRADRFCLLCSEFTSHTARIVWPCAAEQTGQPPAFWTPVTFPAFAGDSLRVHCFSFPILPIGIMPPAFWTPALHNCFRDPDIMDPMDLDILDTFRAYHFYTSHTSHTSHTLATFRFSGRRTMDFMDNMDNMDTMDCTGNCLYHFSLPHPRAAPFWIPQLRETLLSRTVFLCLTIHQSPVTSHLRFGQPLRAVGDWLSSGIVRFPDICFCFDNPILPILPITLILDPAVAGFPHFGSRNCGRHC